MAKTVVLTLTNSPLMTPVNYEIGSPSEQSCISKSGGATNLPPAVSIIQPKDGDVFYTPTNILILAKASDPDGFVTNVEFFAGPLDLGSGTPVVLDPPGVNGITGLVYLYNWLNPPAAGSFPLSAVATDNGGLSTTSAPVNISVLQGPRVVYIYRPTNGATFFTPVDIPIYATASASNGIASVEFYVDGQDLGLGVLDGCVTNPPTVPICIYSLVWSNASVGNHVLTAVLTDDDGLSTTSLPVNINVLQGPPTNLPPVVRIVSPANGSVFRAPIKLPLYAFASDPDGSVTSVRIFRRCQQPGFRPAPAGGGTARQRQCHRRGRTTAADLSDQFIPPDLDQRAGRHERFDRRGHGQWRAFDHFRASQHHHSTTVAAADQSPAHRQYCGDRSHRHRRHQLLDLAG